MEIVNVRVVNDQLDTPEGTIHAPTTFFMDVKLEAGDQVGIPISYETYKGITDLIANELPN